MHALVVGCTGLVGTSLVSRLLQNPKWTKVIGLSRSPSKDNLDPRMSCVFGDLSTGNFEPLPAVTHVFYASWSHASTNEEEYTCNVRLLQNLLKFVSVSNANQGHTNPKLLLVHGTKAYGIVLGPHRYDQYQVPYVETLGRHSQPPWNFYFGHEDLLQSMNYQDWLAVRPGPIIGFSSGRFYNLGVGIAVYATLCRYLDKPFRFPGPRSALYAKCDVTSADMLSQLLEWLALDFQLDSSKSAISDHCFNAANGDVFTWEVMWPYIAELFNVPYEFPQEKDAPMDLLATFATPEMEQVWDKIVQENSLAPYNLNELVPWIHLNLAFRRDYDAFSSMQKAYDNGFTGRVETQTMFQTFFDTLRKNKVIP